MMPVAEPMFALVVGELLHTPPATLLVSGTQSPTQMLDGPVMAAGIAETDTVIAVAHPDGKV